MAGFLLYRAKIELYCKGGDRLKLQLEKVGRTLVVRISGDLDLESAPAFRDKIDNVLTEYEMINKLVLNLAEVNFVDSSGLGAILGRYKKMRSRGGFMYLTEVEPSVSKVFELSGLFKIIPLEHTNEDSAI